MVAIRLAATLVDFLSGDLGVGFEFIGSVFSSTDAMVNRISKAKNAAEHEKKNCERSFSREFQLRNRDDLQVDIRCKIPQLMICSGDSPQHSPMFRETIWGRTRCSIEVLGWEGAAYVIGLRICIPIVGDPIPPACSSRCFGKVSCVGVRTRVVDNPRISCNIKGFMHL